MRICIRTLDIFLGRYNPSPCRSPRSLQLPKTQSCLIRIFRFRITIRGSSRHQHILHYTELGANTYKRPSLNILSISSHVSSNGTLRSGAWRYRTRTFDRLRAAREAKKVARSVRGEWSPGLTGYTLQCEHIVESVPIEWKG